MWIQNRNRTVAHSIPILNPLLMNPNLIPTQNLLPEIKRCIALGWAAFSKVANIMKSRKASMNVKKKVHNEYVLPVMVYGSEAWPLKKAHMELLSVAQRKMERIMLGITLQDHKRNTLYLDTTSSSFTVPSGVMISRLCRTSYQSSPSSAIPCFPRDSLRAFRRPFCDVTAV